MPLPRCLVFCGLPGTGKTHLACAIAKSLVQGGIKTRYFTTAELIRLLRATWQPDRREPPQNGEPRGFMAELEPEK